MKTVSHKNFTLIELLVVIFIVGFILTLAFTALDDLTTSSRLASSARQLGDYISLARNEAAAQGKVIQIHYDLDNQLFWMEISNSLNNQGGSLDHLLEQSEENNPNALPPVPLKEGVLFEDITLSKDITKTSGKVVVSFSPFGFSAGHIVHLKTAIGEQKISIEINGLTGISSYYDKYKEFDQVIEFVDEE